MDGNNVATIIVALGALAATIIGSLKTRSDSETEKLRRENAELVADLAAEKKARADSDAALEAARGDSLNATRDLYRVRQELIAHNIADPTERPTA